MKIGTITLLVLLAFTALSSAAYAEGEIYKIVNPDGSVTFTDQKPSPGAEPVQLKPLSVVETETPPAPAAPATASDPASTEPTERDLRRMYSDFSITQPQNEETFWGTANQVTVSWGSAQALQDGMRVVFNKQGKPDRATMPDRTTLEFDYSSDSDPSQGWPKPILCTVISESDGAEPGDGTPSETVTTLAPTPRARAPSPRLVAGVSGK